MEDHRPAEHGGCCTACPGNVGWIGGGPRWTRTTYLRGSADLSGVQARRPTFGRAERHAPCYEACLRLCWRRLQDRRPFDPVRTPGGARNANRRE